jgi:hypothetical protein
MRRTRSIIGSLLLSASALACAMDIPTYEKQRKESATSQTYMRLRIYLLGLGEGFRLANLVLSQRSDPLLFCAPEQPAMTADVYKQVIEASLSQARDMLVRQERSIESILLEGLQDRHPCDKRTAEPARPPQDTAPRP